MDDRWYTERLGEALAYACEIHARQARKGKDEPYVSHILMVASLVTHYGGTEDQIIAGALHDAVEDGGGMPIAREIDDRFGAHVAEMVLDCSDATPAPGEVKAPWEQRKKDYIDGIRRPSTSGARLVEACDKLANLRDIVEDVEDNGRSAFDHFKGGFTGTMEYYATLREVLMPQVDKPGLRREYSRLFARLQELTDSPHVAVWEPSSHQDDSSGRPSA